MKDTIVKSDKNSLWQGYRRNRMVYQAQLTEEDYEDIRINVQSSFKDIANRIPSDFEVMQIIFQLPKEIILKVFQWGGNDTEVRDEIYVWIRDEFRAEE